MSTPDTTAQQQEVKLDVRSFYRHLTHLMDHWRASNSSKAGDSAAEWGNCDAVAILNGDSDDLQYKKSSMVITWLLGWEFMGTLLLVTRPASSSSSSSASSTSPASAADSTTSGEGGATGSGAGDQGKALFYASAKKVGILQQLIAGRVDGDPIVELMTRDAAHSSEQKERLTQEIKRSLSGKKIGTLLKEKHKGSLAKDVLDVIVKNSTAEFDHFDLTAAISGLLAIKDSAEQRLMKQSAALTVHMATSELVQELETLIDQGTAATMTQLSQDLEKKFGDATLLSQTLKLVPDFVEVAYSPIIQSSSGNFDVLELCKGHTMPVKDTPLDHSVVVYSVGARYKSYCSNVARTIFVDSTKHMEAAYRALFDVQAKLIDSLKPGYKVCDAVARARAHLEATRPDLLPLLTPTLGCGIGLELRESALLLSSKNQTVVRPGMVFNVAVGMTGVKRDPANNNKKFDMMVADTVLINENGSEVLTLKSSKKWTDVSYTLSDEETTSTAATPAAPQQPAKKKEAVVVEDEDEEEADDEEEEADEEEDGDREVMDQQEVNAKKARLRENKPESVQKAESRKQHQQELAQRMHQEKLKGADGTQSDEEEDNEEEEETDETTTTEKKKKKKNINSVGKLKNKAMVSYENGPAAMPSMVSPIKIIVDTARKSLVLPIFGYMVPFHASTIRNATQQDDCLRINFISPGGAFSGGVVSDSNNKDSSKEGNNNNNNNTNQPAGTIFIKELTYKISDPKELTALTLSIQDMRKKLSEQIAAAKDKKDEEEHPQEQLVLSRSGPNPRLIDLGIQPGLSGKRVTGTLEAHSNGFRYMTSRGVPIDILYRNIKHAFFQPPEGELIVLLHFHLHSPIMVGKKKTKDVQFFKEVMEVSAALDRRHGHLGDQEELEEEQREREMRKKEKRDFENFYHKVEELHHEIEFDTPYRELGFYGAPARGNVFLQPTVHCLVNLTETPFFVLSLDEVELCHLERVSPSYKLRNFDMVFVFKDYNLPVAKVNSVPTESLEQVKNWLDSIDIKYYEGPASLNWNHIMTTVRGDVTGFFESGGWSFLEPESSEGEEDDDEEEGSDFDPENDPESAALVAEQSSSDDDDEYTDASDESDGGGGAGGAGGNDKGSGDEDGEDWSDMEKELVKEDNKKRSKPTNHDDDNDDGVAAGPVTKKRNK